MIKNINFNKEITDRINNGNSKFFYKIPNHNGTIFILKIIKYLKDDEKFLLKKIRLTKISRK